MSENLPKRVVAGLVLLATMASGCSSTRTVSETDEVAIDIAWLSKTLQDAGIFVTERGSPDLAIPAISSSRMVLDGRETLDAFYFERKDKAQAVAYEFANMNPDRNVYVKMSLVVVRSGVRDTGLALTIHNLLGEAL